MIGFPWEQDAVYIPVHHTPTDEQSAIERVVTEIVHYGAGNPGEMAVHLAYSYRFQPDIWLHLIDAAATDPLADRIGQELCQHLRYLLIDYPSEMPAYLLQDPPPEDCYLMPGPIHDDHTYFAFVHGHATTMRDRKGRQITRRDTFDELARGLRALRKWCVDMRSGRVSPPRKRGGVASYNVTRDQAIVLAIDNLQAVTNLPVMSLSSRSACEAIGERIGLDAEAVYAVYKRKSAAILDQKARTLDWARERGLR